MNNIKIIPLILLLSFSFVALSQEKKDINEMTKEDVLELTYDELLEMPFEDVLKLAEIVGVSMEELYKLLLNKDVISASKKVESSFEAPLSTSVISYEEILASGARSIEEALRLVPGLIVREKTNGNFDVHIRGNDNVPPNHMFLYSENSITLVMIDGRPVYNYTHGGTFWESLPIGIDDIDRIEVVRGPSSALYGPNAVSGVVNIITQHQESKKLNVNANVQGGSQNTLISSIGIGKKLSDKFGFRITGSFDVMERNTDKLYVHRANNGKGSFITKEELEKLKYPNDTTYYVFDFSDDIDLMYPSPRTARERYGVNAYLFYDVNDDMGISLKSGYQESEILSSTMGDTPTSMSGRVSQTGYTDFNAKIKGLSVKANYLFGVQDIVRQDTGFKVDITNINASAEYDFNLNNNLNIRPGFSYQLSKYNDMPHLRHEGQGFLNGERDFNSIALSLRADYILLDNIRLIGALRGEKYNTHDDIYLSYQLITSYSLNDKHNLRFVYSKANRGAFLVDSYANFLWQRDGRPEPGYILFKGQKNLDLLTMNMFEIGYRVKPLKSVMVDIEGFYSKTKDFGALYPDSVNITGLVTGTSRAWVRMSYNTLDLKAEQYGMTAAVSWVANENLLIKLYGTYQLTNLENAITLTQDETVYSMIDTAGTKPGFYNVNFPSGREDLENKATPTFYGGAYINYKTLNEKLNLNLNTYFYSKQEFLSKYARREGDKLLPEIVDAKMVLNAKASYSILPRLQIFINVRNIMGEKREFAFMDEISTLYLTGITFRYE